MADVLFYSHTTTATTNATNTDNDDDDAVVASSLVFFRQRHRPRGGYIGVGVIVTGIIGVPSDDTIHQYYIDPQRFHNECLLGTFVRPFGDCQYYPKSCRGHGTIGDCPSFFVPQCTIMEDLL